MNKTIIIMGLLMLCTGCSFTRYTAIPQVNDRGETISTRFKYRLEEYRLPKGMQIDNAQRVKLTGELRKTMVEMFPGVFSDDGLPFIVTRGDSKFSQGSFGVSFLNALVFFGSAFTIPRVLHNYRDTSFSFDLCEDDAIYEKADVKYIEDIAVSLSPIAMFCYTDRPDVPSDRRFWYVREYAGGTASLDWPGCDPRIVVEPNRKALAYAVAVKLKELEDSGRIEGTTNASESGTVNEF